jgi:quercetin dioxygenase-like cupin family protein
MKAKYVRLFADSGGESHFQDLESELSSVDFAASAPPLFVSPLYQATQVSFFGAPTEWRSDWHPSSGRNLFSVISGEWEIEASDGEVRRFSQGDVMLVEDTRGKGHTSRVIGQENSLALLVSLPE